MTDIEEVNDGNLEDIVSDDRYNAWAAMAVQEMYSSDNPSKYFFDLVEDTRPEQIKHVRWYRDNILDMYLDSKRYWHKHREYDENVAETLAMADTYKYILQRANGGAYRYRKMTESGL